MKYPHIITNNSVVAFIDGQRHTCKCDSIRYKAVLNSINKNDDEAFRKAMTESEIQSFSKATNEEGFICVNGVVSLDGIEIIGSLQTKLKRMIAEDHNIEHFVSFIRNLRKNPSRTSITELYDFLSYSELPISEDGCFIAYKGVQDSYYSVRSGDLKLKSGSVKNGHILNNVGAKISCDRSEIDDNRDRTCSRGLHVGSCDYAKTWGAITVVVKVNPADVVSVPSDCGCQKLRCCAYEVIADFGAEIKNAVVDSEGNGFQTERQKLAVVIDGKVASLSQSGVVTLKRLQSSLSPACSPLFTLRDILVRDLGYSVSVDPDNKTSIGAMIVE